MGKQIKINRIVTVFLVCFLLVGSTVTSIAQNVGINSTGAAADNSALLDLDASNRGFLMTRSDTSDISSPAFGLMTISPGDSCLYLYNGSGWMGLGGGGCCCRISGSPFSGTIASLDCGGATINGSLTDGSPANGVSADISYTGGNGNSHGGQTISSTGVTGLTAILDAGSFANGPGVLTYSIVGTPASVGAATFALNIGGQMCNLVVPVTPVAIICDGITTVVNDVTSSATGAIWMDRNLGASQVATSSTDASSYGDVYQWGRFSDGHQCRTSNTTTTISSSDLPGHDDFIISNAANNWDWRSPQNDNLWQGVTGINNPCPTGYRIPTASEWQAESISNSSSAFSSPLKLPVTGYRNIDGSFSGVGSFGRYWSSSLDGNNAGFLHFNNSSSAANNYIVRSYALAVRCIKD